MTIVTHFYQLLVFRQIILLILSVYFSKEEKSSANRTKLFQAGKQ